MVVAQTRLFEESPQETVTLKGTVERIIVSRGAWGIVLLRQGREEWKVKGSILPLPTQSEVSFTGGWEEDAYRPGEQIFEAKTVDIEKATTRRGLIQKLAELPHIGPHRATVLVEMFGEDPKEILAVLRDPTQVSRVPGLTESRALAIAAEIEAAAWGVFMERDVQLLKYLPRWIVNAALKRWPGPPVTKQSALEILNKDPYRLMELSNVGFKRADKAAMDIGIPVSDSRRADAALQHVLEQAAQSDGHTWISLDQAEEWSQKERVEGVARRQLEDAARRGLAAEKVEADHALERISSIALAAAEATVGYRALSLAQETPCVPIDPYALNPNLTALQAQAVLLAQTRRMLILTGGPGTGKTYTIKAIISALREHCPADFMYDQPIRLCAPTGKAARRMAEMTDMPAQTVHQLLGYNFEMDAFNYGDGAELPAKVVICDESSMLDVRLAGQLFSALPKDARLILVGDVDQLPSVGPGNVLSDLIESGKVPVVRLEQIMRQADGSAIVTNAHALIHGEDLLLDNSPTDFKFFEIPESEIKREEREATQKELLWVHEQVRSFGYRSDQIQVLSPQKAGEIGTMELNRQLRHILNPPVGNKPEIEVQGQNRLLRQGDRVIQTKNDYELHVMNGQIGTVGQVEPPDPQQSNQRGAALVALDDDGGMIRYPAGALQHLHLAYAITVHKSQGSEWPVVIVPVSTSHAKTLSRRLLYTAITRARKLVVLVGTQKALRYARKNIQDARRQTRLLGMLRGQE
jgi:exodeoxyribonuclease V alpha subunit